MLRVAGYLDKSGAPAIKLSLSGPVHDPQEFEAIIDTGFSGFVSIPLLKAFPLGLILYGTTKVTFADGSTATKLTALGRVTIGDVKKIGLVLLEEGSTDILIGMDFLKRFGVSLLVHPSMPLITLIDETAVSKAFEDAAKTVAAAQAAKAAGEDGSKTPAEDTPDSGVTPAPAPSDQK